MSEDNAPGGKFTFAKALILALLVVVTAAIAVQFVGSSQIRNKEAMAAGSLKSIGTVMIDFRGGDRDGDRINTFWTDDVQGLYDLCDLTDQPIRLVEVSIARADGDVGTCGKRAGIVPKPPKPKNGYWFVAFDRYEVPKGSPDPGLYNQNGKGEHNSRHAHMVKPDRYGVDGNRQFLVNESNVMYQMSDPALQGQGPVTFPYPLKPPFEEVPRPSSY